MANPRIIASAILLVLCSAAALSEYDPANDALIPVHAMRRRRTQFPEGSSFRERLVPAASSFRSRRVPGLLKRQMEEVGELPDLPESDEVFPLSRLLQDVEKRVRKEESREEDDARKSPAEEAKILSHKRDFPSKIMPFASLYPDKRVDKRSSGESDASFFQQVHADKKEVVEIRGGEENANESVEEFLRRVQELPPTKYFNYASGLEHHSSFWDPSYDAMELPAGYGEDVERKRKRESGQQDQAVVGELKDILEDEQKRSKRIATENDTTVQAPPSRGGRRHFDDWLRGEYYKNLAQSMVTMRKRRKRNPSIPKRVTKRSSEDGYEDVHERLRSIEDALILEALGIVQAGAANEADRQKLSNRLDAAYDLESMRLALEDLQEAMDRIGREDSNKKDKRGGGDAPPPECPPLELLTSDCSVLADVVPPDSHLQKLFLHACNWHEVCYSCGEAFGLTSSDCDVGFLAQSHTVCQDDAPCETTARLSLSPLRQRRVFYKRSIPDACYQYPCVQEFLHLR